MNDLQTLRSRDLFLHFEAWQAPNQLSDISDSPKVKKLKHSLSAYNILGQELSELLAEAMRMKDHMHQELDTIQVSTHKLRKSEYITTITEFSQPAQSWLISWHHLECYFSKLEVTRDYLAQLSDTSGLHSQKSPLLRRSRRYNLRIPADRVEVGLMYARIILELMGEYHSIQKLGVIEQLQS